MGYIYKITNIVSGKVYIGETKVADPNDRWKGHINSLNCKKGGCPALKDAMKSYGVENFRFDVLIICFDDARLQLEREYIKRYNSMVPNGYNILEGGQMGGGFKGKKHSPETIQKIQEKLKIFYEKHPEVRVATAARVKESMKQIDVGARLRASEKFKKAVAEGRIGGNIVHHNPEVKNKISESLKKYFENNGPNKLNIEKHRQSMAKAKGQPVNRCDKDGKILATYISGSEAARVMSVRAAAIQRVLKGEPHFTCCGWHWRYASV